MAGQKIDKLIDAKITQNHASLYHILHEKLNLNVTIPQYENGQQKMQLQVHEPAEILSAIELTFKRTELNFQRDPDDPTIFKPSPIKIGKEEADKLKIASSVSEEFIAIYNKMYEQTSEIKEQLLARRTGWEKFTDSIKNNPKITFAFSVVGFLFGIIPGIILTVLYFTGTNHTKPIDDFITALGTGKEAAQGACKTFSHFDMRKDAFIGSERIFHVGIWDDTALMKAIGSFQDVLSKELNTPITPTSSPIRELSTPITPTSSALSQTVTPQQPNPAPYSSPVSTEVPEAQEQAAQRPSSTPPSSKQSQ